MQRILEGSYQGSPIEERGCGRIENNKGLCSDEGRVIPQNARKNFIKMCEAQGGPKKNRGGA